MWNSPSRIRGAMHAFRMDDRKQRLIADGGLPDGERFFGWEGHERCSHSTLTLNV
jgi:hypothetical protein